MLAVVVVVGGGGGGSGLVSFLHQPLKVKVDTNSSNYDMFLFPLRDLGTAV